MKLLSASQVLIQDKSASILYNPRSISSLALWLDANSLNDILTDGSPVSSWTDKSSYAHVAAQSNASYRPTFYSNKWNGNSVVYANSAESDFLTVPYHSSLQGSNITLIIAVMNYGAPNDTNIISKPYATSGWPTPYVNYGCSLGPGDSTYRPYMNIGSPGGYKQTWSNTRLEPYLSGIITFIYDGTATIRIYINGVQMSTTANQGGAYSGNLAYPNQTSVNIFSRGEYSNGLYTKVYLGDAFIYNTALSTNDRGIVENYLKLKYGLVLI